MSLDRQRILGELGSVMNQLKSVDCGCMGKLFTNQSQGQSAPMVHGSMGSSLPTCGSYNRGCCNSHGHTHGSPCAGEPYSMGSGNNHSLNRSCMGNCNPHKLYADTYSYLNNNLMQPVVKEVYEDLKSINPTNTIMNNAMACQMGLSNSSGARETGNSEHMTNPMQNLPTMSSINMNSSAGQSHPNPIGSLGGMGPQIVNMIMGESKPSNVHQTPGQVAQPGGTIGNDYLSPGQFEAMNVAPTQYNVDMSDVNKTMGNTGQDGASAGNPQMINNNGVAGHSTNSGVQQVTTHQYLQQNPASVIQNAGHGAQQIPVANKQAHYNQHTQGMRKFNEMFPGVMQGGDLGFDPMAIAIQMNPANQQKAAINTMQRIMSGGSPGKLNVDETPVKSNQMRHQRLNDQIPVQQLPAQASNQPYPEGTVQSQLNTGTVPQQQMYTAVTGQPTFYQKQMQSCQQLPDPMNQFQQQNQSFIQPNSNEIIKGTDLPNVNKEVHEVDMSLTEATMKEPNQPKNSADSSRNQPIKSTTPQQFSQYNTLGQPVEMLPAKMFHNEEPSLPQTLSPQPPPVLQNDHMKYSTVKSTVSRTSLTGIKPVGKQPSRSQLQHIYNQYKGSQSFTQHNNQLPVQGGTISDGGLNNNMSSNANIPQRVPVETEAGITGAKNDIQTKVRQELGEVGDVPAANKPRNETSPVQDPSTLVPARQAKLRNGLQDVVYTSYPSSAAWSFHGTPTYRPASMKYRA